MTGSDVKGKDTMYECPFFEKFTWGEPPLEPGENGTVHTEYQCKKAPGYYYSNASCDGDLEFCNVGQFYGNGEERAHVVLPSLNQEKMNDD